MEEAIRRLRGAPLETWASDRELDVGPIFERFRRALLKTKPLPAPPNPSRGSPDNASEGWLPKKSKADAWAEIAEEQRQAFRDRLQEPFSHESLREALKEVTYWDTRSGRRPARLDDLFQRWIQAKEEKREADFQAFERRANTSQASLSEPETVPGDIDA